MASPPQSPPLPSDDPSPPLPSEVPFPPLPSELSSESSPQLPPVVSSPQLPSEVPSPQLSTMVSSPQRRPRLRTPVVRPLGQPRPQYPPPPYRLRPPVPRPLPPPPRTQVFVSFRGSELRDGFVSHVVKSLELGGVDVFIDSYEQKGRDIENLLKRIDNSKVALVIFSDRFSQSNWCLKELVRIDERVRENKLVVIPVFYRISTDDVKYFGGKFGECFNKSVKTQPSDEPPMAERWKAAVKSVASKTGFTSHEHRMDSRLVDAIVGEIKKQVPVTSQGEQMFIITELVLTAVLACVCQFIAPLVFNDVSVYKTRQWFVGVLFLVVIRRNFF